MNYLTEAIAASLKEARTLKGLSQRDLSVLTGVPQAQISRIEAGVVDLRTTTLIALAHALDLELVLVPRKAIPAVKSISRQSAGQSAKSVGQSSREINRIAESLRALQINMPALEGVARLQKDFADLQQRRLRTIESDALRKWRKMIEQIQKSTGQHEAIISSQKTMKALSNQLNQFARASILPMASVAEGGEDSPKPAYSLDEDDNA